MLTAVNCFLLWGFAWLQFVTMFSCFSYQGRNLWFWTVIGKSFGFTIPESFLGVSIGMVLFAVCAVAGGTWRTPRLWKRLLTVSIFAAIVLGFSLMNLHLRHYSYDMALAAKEDLRRSYHRNLTLHYNSEDLSTLQWLDWERSMLEDLNAQIRLYEQKYRLSSGDGGKRSQ